MEAYKQLLDQFHSQQASIIEDDSMIKYLDLLNIVKNSKQKKLQTKTQMNHQFIRLKSQNKDISNASTLQASFITSFNSSFFTQPFNQQKKKLIQLQNQSLLKQVDDLKKGIRHLQMDKKVLENQINIIDAKEIQIKNALFESEKSLEELRIHIKDQKAENIQNFVQYDKKIEQMTQKLKGLHEQNVLNSKYCKQKHQISKQNQAHSLFSTILMWQKQQSKIKQIPKKIYTKKQIQSILRAIFLIIRLSQLNYGNIIQDLVKKQEQNILIQRQNQKILFEAKQKQKSVYLKKNGQQIPIKFLVTKLQSDIISVEETKFISKMKIIEYYETKGVLISKAKDGSFSLETNKLTETIIKHFKKLTSWFSRIQNRNIQLSQNLKNLQKLNDNMSQQIKSMEQTTKQNSINYLQLREQQIHKLHEKQNDTCKIIFQFNINVYDLIKRIQNINKFFDKIIKSINRKTYKKTYVENQQDSKFLKKFKKILFKSPECIILDWNKVISNKNSSGEEENVNQLEDQQQRLQNQIYYQKIMKNDMLRIYAQPSMFNNKIPYIQNYSNTFNYVMKQQKEIISRLSQILKDLLLFSKNGIINFNQYKKQEKQQRKKSTILKDKQVGQQLNPLLKILKQSDAKLQKFFARDQIKEQEKVQHKQSTKELEKKQEFQNPLKYCVQSNEYYRRDNYKIIQKLQKLDLKRRGIITTSPFSVDTSLQLQPSRRKNRLNLTLQIDSTQQSFNTTALNTYRRRQPRLSHQALSTRHNQLSQRRQLQNIRKKDLKTLLQNISNIASQNQKYRIRKKLFTKDNFYSTKESHQNSLSRSKICF